MAEWRAIDTCPEEHDNPVMWFKAVDGRIFKGVWNPYWCGSDCPCNVANESEFDDIFSSEPVCWCCYPMVDNQIASQGLSEDPTHWAVCDE
jgi:hypothetical protein